MTAHLVERFQNRPLCPSGKRPLTEAECKEALRTVARLGKDRVHSKPGRVERSYDYCKGCGWYHLSGWEGKFKMSRSRRRR